MAVAVTERRRLDRAGRLTVLVLAGWAALVAIAAVWGVILRHAGVRLELPAPPLQAEPMVRFGVRMAAPMATAAVVIWWGPRVAAVVSWRVLLLAAGLATVGWGVALAFVDGWGGVTRGLSWWFEYPADVTKVGGDPFAFLRSFTERIDQFEVHVRGHPPGFVLGLWAVDRIGPGGPGAATGICLAGAGLATAGVLSAARWVAGEDLARRAAPFVVLAPAALWLVSSADAVYAAVAAWTLAVAARAVVRQSTTFAVAAGLLYGLGLLGSYGLVLMAVPVALIARYRSAPGFGAPFATAFAGGAGAVLGGAAMAGFWWPAGLSATIHEYRVLDLERPYLYFAVANLAALGLQLGPAVAVGLTRLRDRGERVLVGGCLAAMALAHVSGLSKGEVERIWLPFGLPVLVAGAALGRTGAPPRRWLALQAATAIAIEVTVRTLW